mgnify:CR=1 FL=1
MSPYYVILDNSPDRISRLRFLLHLRGIQALLAMNADEVLNWSRACRHSDAEMLGVILYDEPDNKEHLQTLDQEAFELPVYAIANRHRVQMNDFGGLDLLLGSVDEIMQLLPSWSAENPDSLPFGLHANGVS